MLFFLCDTISSAISLILFFVVIIFFLMTILGGEIKSSFVVAMIFILCCGIMIYCKNYKNQSLVSEEGMRFVEKNFGLVDFYAKAKQKLIAKQSPNDNKSPSDNEDFYYYSFYGKNRNKIGELNVFSDKVKQETYHRKVDVTIWRDDVSYVNFNPRETERINFDKEQVWGIILIGALVALPIIMAFYLITSYLYKNKIKTKMVLPVMIVFLIVILCLYYPHNYPYFFLPDGNSMMVQLKDKQNLEKIGSFMQQSTKLIDAKESDIIWGRDLLIGGDDFFNENFLCWKFDSNNYCFYFNDTTQSHNLLSKCSNNIKYGDNLFMVRYEEGIFYSTIHWATYIITILGCGGIMVGYTSLARRRNL